MPTLHKGVLKLGTKLKTSFEQFRRSWSPSPGPALRKDEQEPETAAAAATFANTPAKTISSEMAITSTNVSLATMPATPVTIGVMPLAGAATSATSSSWTTYTGTEDAISASTQPAAPSPICVLTSAAPLTSTSNQTISCATALSSAPLPPTATSLCNFWSVAL